MARPSPTNRRHRLPPIDPAKYSPEQDTAVAAFSTTGRPGLRGPFPTLLYSPELFNRTQHLGAYLRFDCGIPQRLREFAILIASRVWQQEFEWHSHVTIAAECGVALATIEAIAEDVEPVAAAADEIIVYRFCTELHRTREVSDPVFADAQALLGDVGVVELSALCGYYALLAMVMNVAGSPTPGEPFALPD